MRPQKFPLGLKISLGLLEAVSPDFEVPRNVSPFFTMAVKYPLKFFSEGSESYFSMVLAYLSFLAGVQVSLLYSHVSMVLN